MHQSIWMKFIFCIKQVNQIQRRTAMMWDRWKLQTKPPALICPYGTTLGLRWIQGISVNWLRGEWVIDCKNVEYCSDFIIVIYVHPQKANESLFSQVMSQVHKNSWCCRTKHVFLWGNLLSKCFTDMRQCGKDVWRCTRERAEKSIR